VEAETWHAESRLLACLPDSHFPADCVFLIVDEYFHLRFEVGNGGGILDELVVACLLLCAPLLEQGVILKEFLVVLL